MNQIERLQICQQRAQRSHHDKTEVLELQTAIQSGVQRLLSSLTLLLLGRYMHAMGKIASDADLENPRADAAQHLRPRHDTLLVLASSDGTTYRVQ